MEKKSYANLFSYVLIGIFAIWLFVSAMGWTPVPMGESDDYMLTTVSLQYRGDLAIQDSDLEHAVADFPEFADYLTTMYHSPGGLSSFTNKAGGQYSWYFGTYSALCIPAKVVLGLLGLPQIYAFAVTNCLLYLLALWVTARYLRASQGIKLILLLLLMANPAVFYVVWQSAEVCVFAFTVMALVFFTRRSYPLAGLLISLAGTLNSTVMIVGVFFILCFFADLLREVPVYRWPGAALRAWPSVLKVGVSFVPCLVPFIFYYINCGVFNLQVGYGFSQIDGLWQRFRAYLTDWNFGIMPYFFVAFCLSAFLLVWCVIRRQYRCLGYFLSFLGVVAAYSLMQNINCAMSGIARYNAWAAPILLFGAAMTVDGAAFPTKLKRWAGGLLAAGAICTAALVGAYGPMFAHKTSDIQLTPVAQAVLNYCPQFYWSMPSTFNCRVNHVPGGYQYEMPLVYANEAGEVKKALVSSDSWQIFKERVDQTGNEALWARLERQMDQAKQGQRIYINVLYGQRLLLKAEAAEEG